MARNTVVERKPSRSKTGKKPQVELEISTYTGSLETEAVSILEAESKTKRDKKASNYNTLVARILRRARMAAGITQEDMGKALAPYMEREEDVNKAQISAIERGANRVTVGILIGYCNICGISPDSVFKSFVSDELYEIIRARESVYDDPLIKKLTQEGNGIERMNAAEAVDNLEDIFYPSDDETLKRGRPSKVPTVIYQQKTLRRSPQGSVAVVKAIPVSDSSNSDSARKMLMLERVLAIQDENERMLALKILADENKN